MFMFTLHICPLYFFDLLALQIRMLCIEHKNCPTYQNLGTEATAMVFTEDNTNYGEPLIPRALRKPYNRLLARYHAEAHVVFGGLFCFTET